MFSAERYKICKLDKKGEKMTFAENLLASY
jgi:hypothetical protein